MSIVRIVKKDCPDCNGRGLVFTEERVAGPVVSTRVITGVRDCECLESLPLEVYPGMEAIAICTSQKDAKEAPGA